MSRPISELTGNRPRSAVKKTAEAPGVSVRWTEAHHITYLRLGGSKWLRQMVEKEMTCKQQEQKPVYAK